MSAQGKALEISRQGTDIKDACSIQNPQLRDADVVVWQKNHQNIENNEGI
jgi:hypothetical protein